MPAKAPIYLKPTNSKKGKKCRLRDILSPDMISPPLGDFRHTIHIGRGGERDAFGDMSFLQGKYELLPGKGDFQTQYGVQAEFLRANSTGDASFVETPSPVLKNAISLPTIGGCQALTLPLISSTVFSMPPEPLGDIISPTSSVNPDTIEDVEMQQVDALLHSMDNFSSKPSPPFRDIQSKPDVLLDLLENMKKPNSKAAVKANIAKTKESRIEKKSTYYINGHSNNSYKANGSLHSNTSDDSSESYAKEEYKTQNYNDSSRLNDKRNTLGHFRNNINLEFKQEVSKCNGEWVDRDSGVEEGRISDFDFEFSKEMCTSQESLTRITGSLLSLELDLGPSILDDVLNIMDQPAVKSRP
ncbi:cdc42 effector protein 3 [Syngnathoides biaculeatus]|uniref:cdc42 effector protein 3 n=1 Tax=Syngnathoides biaculeatus TaxID=300417 RepID=UPI002ADE48CF|nr:cdc42 effector protein 3 [Syngnathoides biaculeatus]XP_061693944.1 cdc42 effector protein 3 [Syngnathoides biaculeatus]XP_061693945.1 cdc42 effector protein 3 [Syngnathoides biaculeatus]XP_061693946.1 cdc42 effector protein 3 [Syngnathoides biaculeatus]XP_061693947.1 cdc42 effector protein 3 [Syngnathoides biaculeatus]